MKASAVYLSAANFSINFMGFAADICSAHGGNQTGKAALIKLRQVYNLEHGVILIKISKNRHTSLRWYDEFVRFYEKCNCVEVLN